MQSLMLDEDDDDDDDDQPPTQQKRLEKSVLVSQLRVMHERLNEVQQKYVQLCTIMGQTPDSQEIDDATSDTFESMEKQKETPEKQLIRRSVPSSPSPMKEHLSLNSKANANMLSQVMGKMISSKMHNHLPAQAQLPPNFNGAHPLLQQMNMSHNSHEHAMQQLQHSQPQHQHNALNNAAAMYFGKVSTKNTHDLLIHLPIFTLNELAHRVYLKQPECMHPNHIINLLMFVILISSEQPIYYEFGVLHLCFFPDMVFGCIYYDFGTRFFFFRFLGAFEDVSLFCC